MTSKAEPQASSLDTVKLVIAVALLAAAVGAFYAYADISPLYRALALLAVTAVAVGIAATTAKGRNMITYLQDSRTEVRKMVWPTRAETIQTTLIVFVVVILVGIFLWLLDLTLGWLIRFVIG